MIADENHPFMLAAAQVIGQRLADLCRGKVYDLRLRHEFIATIYDFRISSRQQGLDFPPLTVMAVPRIGAIAVYRRDLEPAGIRGAVLQFIRNHPTVTREEIAIAVTWAWPHIRPRDLIDEGFVIVAKDQAKVAATPEV